MCWLDCQHGKDAMDCCPDCGCGQYNGACVNCHEETYIMRQHIEEPCCRLSDEFIETVERQKNDIDQRQSN